MQRERRERERGPKHRVPAQPGHQRCRLDNPKVKLSSTDSPVVVPTERKDKYSCLHPPGVQDK